MATRFEDALRSVQAVGAKLTELVANRDTPTTQLIAALSDYRRACTSAVHSDYVDAVRHNVEEKLWDMHVKVNSVFRKDTQELKRRGQNNAVEIRKVTRSYLDFLKSSQRFYRAYICELDSYHGGVAELRKVARQLEPQQAVAGSTRGQSPNGAMSGRLLMSCFHSLIHLGDLSRYRETDCSTESAKWGPAIGYYNLATEVYPYSGLSYNQLAIIALHEKVHMRAMYYLYRSLTAREPHPLGRNNLEIEFKKVITAWDKGELIKNAQSRDGRTTNRALEAWFVRLHSKCYKGEEFGGHHELEEEVLGQLTREIKQHPVDILLNRFVMVNVSAEWFTGKKIEGGETSDTNIQSFYFYLQLNVRTFATLLQILLDELEHPIDVNAKENTPDGTSRLSVVARRVLPGIRLYSSWLVEKEPLLSAKLTDSLLLRRIEEMWRVYAAVLTKGTFAVLDQGVPNADYLLEEDSETIGFLPLVTARTEKLWCPNGKPKPRFSDEGVARHHPAKEALIRLKELVVSGIELISRASIPLVYEDMRFLYKPDDDLQKQLGTKAKNVEAETESAPVSAAQPVTRQEVAEKAGSIPAQIDSRLTRTTTDSTSITKESSLNRMVDDLVGDDEGLEALPEERDNLPLTPPANIEHTPMVRAGSDTMAPVTAGDLVQQMFNWGSPKPAQNAPQAVPGSNPSPFLRNAPSPRQHLDTWVHPLQPGVASPQNTAASGAMKPHHTEARQFGTSPSWHNRGTSAASLHPLQTDVYTIPSTRPSTANSITPTIPSRTNALEEMRDVWGVTPNVPTAEWVRQRQPRYREGAANAMTSSALFGTGGGPWSAGGRSSSSHGASAWSPTNGQGG